MSEHSRASLNLYEVLQTSEERPDKEIKGGSQAQHPKKLAFSKFEDEDESDSAESNFDYSMHALAQPYNKEREGTFKSKLKAPETRPSEVKDRPPGGCLNHILGDCPLGIDCRYSHSPEERL